MKINNYEESRDQKAKFDNHVLANALYNWRYGGEFADPYPIMNAIVDALDEDIQVVFPFIVMDENYQPIPKEDLEGVDIFEKYNTDQIVIPVLDSGAGDHWVPVFTSEDELKKGEETFFMYVSLTAAWDLVMADKGCEGLVFNPWSDNVPMEKGLMQEVMDHDAQSHISLVYGDITKLHVDAIVNATNSSLLGGSGVDGAIHKVAGPKLFTECRAIGGCNVGEVKVTSAYRLPAKYIFHTVGPVYDGSQKCGEKLTSCYTSCLELAEELGCRSIAFPCISTGADGYPLNEAVPIALITISDWLAAHADQVFDVYCCCYNQEDFETYWDFMDALSPEEEE